MFYSYRDAKFCVSTEAKSHFDAPLSGRCAFTLCAVIRRKRRAAGWKPDCPPVDIVAVVPILHIHAAAAVDNLAGDVR